MKFFCAIIEVSKGLFGVEAIKLSRQVAILARFEVFEVVFVAAIVLGGTGDLRLSAKGESFLRQNVDRAFLRHAIMVVEEPGQRHGRRMMVRIVDQLLDIIEVSYGFVELFVTAMVQHCTI